MQIEDLETLLKLVKEEFKKAESFLEKWYEERHRKRDQIIYFKNLYRWLRDYAKNRRKDLYAEPAKILNYSSSIRKTTITRDDKTIISQAKGRLEDALKQDTHSYYKTEGKNSQVVFEIDALGRDGKYRLNPKINGESFYDILEQLNKSKKKIDQTERAFDSLDKYLNKTAEKYRYLETRHLGIIFPKDNAIELSRTYIHLKASESVSRMPVFPITEHTTWQSGINRQHIDSYQIIMKETKRLKTAEILKRSLELDNPANRRIVFLGSPGNGKTTFLRHIAFSIASGNAGLYGLSGFVPVFVDLGKYGRSSVKGIINYALSEVGISIVDEGEKNSTIEALRFAISTYGKKGRVIFLLDALDEARDEKNRIVDEIESLANQNEYFVFIVTSRPTAYYKYPLTTFSHCMIQDIQEQSQKEFIRSWFDLYAKQKSIEDNEINSRRWSIERADYLIQEIDKNPNLRRLASNPLYLTFLTFMASDPDTKLPENKASLYRKYFDKLLFDWEEKHQLPLQADILFQGFKEISWVIHRALFENKSSEPTQNQILKSLAASSLENARTILQFWLNSGIFFLVKTKSQEEIILAHHLTFLEYGFGSKLSDLWNNKNRRNEIWRDLKPNIHNKNLREPLSIFAGQIDDFDEFTHNVLSLEDDIFHTNLVLLGKLTKHIKPKENKNIIKDKLLSILIKLWHSKNPFVIENRNQILDCIGTLGGIKVLYPLYNNESDSIRFSILKTIAKIGGEKIISDFVDILENCDERDMKYGIVLCIYKAGDKELAKSLFRDLFDKEGDEDFKSNEAFWIGTAMRIVGLHSELKKEPIQILFRRIDQEDDEDDINIEDFAIDQEEEIDDSDFDDLFETYYDSNVDYSYYRQLRFQMAYHLIKQLKKTDRPKQLQKTINWEDGSSLGVDHHKLLKKEKCLGKIVIPFLRPFYEKSTYKGWRNIIIQFLWGAMVHENIRIFEKGEDKWIPIVIPEKYVFKYIRSD